MTSGEMSPEAHTGRNVAAWRTTLGLSQRELADRMQDMGFQTWVQQTVAEVEAGSRGLGWGELATLGAFFEVSPVELVMRPIPGTDHRVRVGDQALTQGEWSLLWDARIPSELRYYVNAPAVSLLFDKITGGIERTWATAWRRRGKTLPAALAEGYEAVVAQRRKQPGPIFISDEKLTGEVVYGLFGMQLKVVLDAGVPYVARSEAEAAQLLSWERSGLVRKIGAREAYRLRQPKGKKKR